MQIPVLVEQLPDKRYRARAGDPFAMTAEGKTQTEALDKLRKMIEERRYAGAWIVHLDIGNIDNPIFRTCGTLDPDDPMVKEWLQIMEENRRKADEDPDYP
jgi:hypothetical protein